jgi:hypothetical protein
VATNDDDPAESATSAVIFNASAGTEYQIVVAGYAFSFGRVILTLNQTPMFMPRLVSQWFAAQGQIALSVEHGTGSMILERSSDLQNWMRIDTIAQGETMTVSVGVGERQFYRLINLP